MNMTWQNSWEQQGRKHVSDLGWEVRVRGGQFDLYRTESNEWAGIFPGVAEAKDEADRRELARVRAEWATGEQGHIILEGQGGLWDIDVALKIAEGKAQTPVSRVRLVADNTPDGPVICVPLEIARRGIREYKEYILVGATSAQQTFQTEDSFPAVCLTYAEAEVARVPDITDTPEAQAAIKILRKANMYYDPNKAKGNPWKRGVGDLAAYVRKHANL